MDDAVGHIRLSQVDGVAATRNERRQSVGQQSRHPLGVHGESSVVGAGQREYRRFEGRQSIPQRFLSAGAGFSEAGGQARSGVASTFVNVGRCTEMREHRGLHPAINEGVDVATRFEGFSQRVIGRPALYAGFAVLNATGGAYQDGGVEQTLPSATCRATRAPSE